MTTYVPVVLANTSPPFTGLVTLDGETIVVNIFWNLAGQRYYFSLSSTSGDLYWTGPLIGSPLDADIYLAPGVFTESTLLFRADTSNFETVP